MHPNTRRLRQIMTQRNLSRFEVAELLGRSAKTVACWRCESPRPMSSHELERLELKLEVQRLTLRLQYLDAGIEPPASAREGSHA